MDPYDVENEYTTERLDNLALDVIVSISLAAAFLFSAGMLIWHALQ